MEENKTVYIIDDDEIYRFILAKQLRKGNEHQLRAFENGQEAINYMQQLVCLEEQLPDIILLDINMPIMDGWQFLDAYTQLVGCWCHRVQLYVVSSSLNTVDIERAKAYSAVTNYLVKPVSAAVVSDIISPINKRDI